MPLRIVVLGATRAVRRGLPTGPLLGPPLVARQAERRIARTEAREAQRNAHFERLAKADNAPLSDGGSTNIVRYDEQEQQEPLWLPTPSSSSIVPTQPQSPSKQQQQQLPQPTVVEVLCQRQLLADGG